MIPLEPTESRASRLSRTSHHSHTHASHPPSHTLAPSNTNTLERQTSPRPETVRSVEAAGYASPVPIGDGVLESAVAPFHPRPDDEVPASAGGHELDESARIQELIGPPPDGGREAWLCVMAAFGQQFAMFGLSGS